MIVAASAMGSAPAQADSDPCGVNALPPVLPMNGQFTTSTCPVNQNPPCDATPYDYTTSTTLLTLEHASTVTLMLAGSTPFQPAGYLSGGACADGGCGSELPAGNYCLTVAADPSSALGMCGCFTLLVDVVVADPVFASGFD